MILNNLWIYGQLYYYVGHGGINILYRLVNISWQGKHGEFLNTGRIRNLYAFIPNT